MTPAMFTLIEGTELYVIDGPDGGVETVRGHKRRVATDAVAAAYRQETFDGVGEVRLVVTSGTVAPGAVYALVEVPQ